MERRGADPPADLSVGDPEDRGLRVKVGRPEGQQVFERRTSRRAPPGAGGLEGDVLPPEISRFGAAGMAIGLLDINSPDLSGLGPRR